MFVNVKDNLGMRLMLSGGFFIHLIRTSIDPVDHTSTLRGGG